MSRASNLAGFTTSISPPANLSVGIITASSVINVGTGLTLSSGGINVSGVITATSFSGNGSGLTGAGIGTTGSVNTSGIITATSFFGSGSGLTGVGLGTTGSINTSGIITASSFSGNGSGLTGVAATTLTIGAGTTALPSISPTGDSNTGIFFPSADTIAFSEGGAEAMRVDSSGRLLIGISTSGNANGGPLQLSGGITFPATAVAASDANTLDDYEEGTFTPVIEGTTTAGTATYTRQAGVYTKIGREVFYSIDIVYSSGTGTGNLKITGLPFTSSSTSMLKTGSIVASNILLTALNYPTVDISLNATQIFVAQSPVGGGGSTSVTYDAAGQIVIMGRYFV